MVKKSADLTTFWRQKGADLTKKGADLKIFEQHKKGEDLTKKGADLTTSYLSGQLQLMLAFGRLVSDGCWWKQGKSVMVVG